MLVFRLNFQIKKKNLFKKSKEKKLTEEMIFAVWSEEGNSFTLLSGDMKKKKKKKRRGRRRRIKGRKKKQKRTKKKKEEANKK